MHAQTLHPNWKPQKLFSKKLAQANKLFNDLRIYCSNNKIMLCPVYIRNGIAYVPTAAKTQAGFYQYIDPVAVVPVSDTKDFEKVLIQVIGRGHPVVPTPTRESGYPKPVMPKYAKLKTWRAFEKGASSWTLFEKDGIYIIEQWQKRPQGGWLPNRTRDETLPAGMSLDNAVQRFVSQIQKSLADVKP